MIYKGTVLFPFFPNRLLIVFIFSSCNQVIIIIIIIIICLVTAYYSEGLHKCEQSSGIPPKAFKHISCSLLLFFCTLDINICSVMLLLLTLPM